MKFDSEWKVRKVAIMKQRVRQVKAVSAAAAVKVKAVAVAVAAAAVTARRTADALDLGEVGQQEGEVEQREAEGQAEGEAEGEVAEGVAPVEVKARKGKGQSDSA